MHLVYSVPPRRTVSMGGGSSPGGEGLGGGVDAEVNETGDVGGPPPTVGHVTQGKGGSGAEA